MVPPPPETRSRRVPLALLAVAAVAAAAAAAAIVLDRKAGPYNVLLITVDTLRADRLSLYGNPRATSPAIDAWAAGGAVFDSAYAPRGCTWPTLTTIVTGKYPIVHGVRSNGERLRPEHLTLAEMLEAAGYATGAFLTNMTSAPNRGFGEKALCRDFLRPHFEWDRVASKRAVEFMERHARGRFFAWLHLMDPHEPYLPPPPFDEFTAGYSGRFTGKAEELDEIALDPRAPFDSADKEAVVALYDGQIASTDRYLKKVFAALEQLGIEDETLVVFASDHGEELFDHNRYAYHAASIYDAVLRVPFVLRLPGRVPEGRRFAATVEMTDVLPTVLDLLGFPLPSWIEGESLVPLFDGTRTAREKTDAYFEWSPPEKIDPLDFANRVFAVRRGKWKLIANPSGLAPWNRPYRRGESGFALHKLELYDLETDPGETRNLAAEEPATAEELNAALGRWLARAREKAGSSDAPSEESLRQLEQLGYLRGGAGAAATDRDGEHDHHE